MRSIIIIYTLVLLVLLPANVCGQNRKHTFEIKNGEFLYDGKPVRIYSGEMHYPRVPREYWRHRFKMLKAMGLNTVATCVFWNYHNPAPGIWDFETGNRNLAEYIRIAREEGLFVILRPGPYVCAEWEFGGYPWWLQSNKELVIRTNQPFLDSCEVYIRKLAEQVKELQVTRNGPVILIQVENEFGSYVSQRPDIPIGEHRRYYQTIKQMLIEAGFEVPFFTSDGTWLFEGGVMEGVLPAANGETDIENLIKRIDKFYSDGPYMVAEYYPGWLDHWAEPFIRIGADKVLAQIEEYLQNNVHFNFYMAHGGTNFGFTSGANYNDDHDIQPDITSYDYDAPISEAGWPTLKYMVLRELMKQYVKYPVPEIPACIPVIRISEIPLSNTVNLFDWQKTIKPVVADNPLSFEELGQGYGYVLYRRHFGQPVQGKLQVNGLRDYAIVYVNGEKVGELNRYCKTYSLEKDIVYDGTLDILVENMGRINYGAEIVHNKKGIIFPVLINGSEITGDWEMYRIPLETVPDLSGFPGRNIPGLPAFYSGTFELDQTGDVFLDMSEWGKGIVFVNGYNLGRYWNIGPQQSLYLPGCWLKRGINEVVIFEQQNDVVQNVLKTTDQPALEDLRPDY